MQQTDLFCGVCRKLASGICGLQSAFFICPYVHLIKIGSIDMVKLYHIDGCQHTNMKNNKQNFITVRNKADHRSWQAGAGRRLVYQRTPCPLPKHGQQGLYVPI